MGTTRAPQGATPSTQGETHGGTHGETQRGMLRIIGVTKTRGKRGAGLGIIFCLIICTEAGSRQPTRAKLGIDPWWPKGALKLRKSKLGFSSKLFTRKRKNCKIDYKN